MHTNRTSSSLLSGNNYKLKENQLFNSLKMKTTYVLVATLLLVTLLSSAKAACPDCTQHADGAILRDPTSCSHYYKCVQGRSERKSCGSGFYFDERFLICNFAAFVDCKNHGNLVDLVIRATTPAPTCTTTPAPCKPITATCTPTPAPCKPKTTTCAPTRPTPAIDPEPCEPITHEPAIDPEDCDEVTPPPCDSTNHHHHHTSDNFVIDTLRHLSDCKSRKDGTILFDSKHCRRYYVCRAGKARRESCSYGQWIDGHTKTCRTQRYVTNCPANRN